MHIIYSIILVYTFELATAQFNENHVNLLSKINTAFTEPWTPEIEIEEEFNDVLEVPCLQIDLYNHKLWEDNVNEGISVFVFYKQNEQAVKAYNWNVAADAGIKFLSTKTYSIVIDYPLTWNDYYDATRDKVLNEIEEFFTTHAGIL